jgi:hypothetical protein
MDRPLLKAYAQQLPDSLAAMQVKALAERVDLRHQRRREPDDYGGQLSGGIVASRRMLAHL